jgi:hypothetical protein
LRFVTCTWLPSGKVLDAAVRSSRWYISPLAVRWPINPGPYHEAVVTCPPPGLGGLSGSGIGLDATLAGLYEEHPPIHSAAQITQDIRMGNDIRHSTFLSNRPQMILRPNLHASPSHRRPWGGGFLAKVRVLSAKCPIYTNSREERVA